jgi:hypothetical protein
MTPDRGFVRRINKPRFSKRESGFVIYRDQGKESNRKQAIIMHITITQEQEKAMPGMKCFLLALLIGIFAASGWAHAEDFSGRFVASGTGGTIKLTLDQDESGDVSGEMTTVSCW